ncbi:MAG: hypothetical protein RLZZ546_824 [Bacteroidota bacterium]
MATRSIFKKKHLRKKNNNEYLPVNGMSTVAPNNKLSEIRKRREDRNIREIEEQEYNEYKERYNIYLENSIEEIDTLLDYFLNKCEVIVEKEYDAYVIRKEYKDKNYFYLYIRIGTGGITLQYESNNIRENIDLINTTLYQKYYKLFELKHFEYLSRKTKRIVNEIQNITKLNRKTKISRMIEDSESEEE